MNRSAFLKTMAFGTLGLLAGGAARKLPAAQAAEKDKGLVVSCFGDSTTWGANGEKTGGGNAIAWPAKLGAFLDVQKVYNFGKKGSRIAVTVDRQDSFLERLDAVLAQPADLILLLGGVNDFQHDVPLGEYGSTDPATFYGAYETILQKLIAAQPQAHLIVMTPMKENFQHPTKHYPKSFDKNAQGVTQEAYVEAVRQEAARYSLPVFDLFNESGISPFHPAQQKLYMPDGLHYNEAGYTRLAQRIAAGIEAVLD
ncbi:MAG: SGNH/GDSL hydrolase family protein [Selenomonadaceae bacterium]|nr:SGNH/GDSL hydrolase family protein [Selenomonadaceae bacterium]